MITEKAKKGDMIVNDAFLKNLAVFIDESTPGNADIEFSIVCPEAKFKPVEVEAVENEDESSVGQKTIKVGRVVFNVSFIEPKDKDEKPQPLKAKEFALYNAGIYDNKMILDMPWEQYKPFVATLFDLRESPHKTRGFDFDGYIGVHSAFIWNYPQEKKLVIDEGYVKDLHGILDGRAGDKVYVIAPICSMGFMQDEIQEGETIYVFLKVPLSILMNLIRKGEPCALRQPVSEDEINEVIDAACFDFISPPIVQARYRKEKPENSDLLNEKELDFVVEITEFHSKTMAQGPEDFENFETFSMVLIDTDYKDEIFTLQKIFWADKVLIDSKVVLRIPQNEFKGDNMMIIYMDKYGNEFKVLKTKSDFGNSHGTEKKKRSK